MEDFYSQEDQVIIIVLIGVLLLLLMGGSLLLFFFFSRKKIVEKEIENKNLEINHQKEMIQSIILTQEKERKRIAQELINNSVRHGKAKNSNFSFTCNNDKLKFIYKDDGVGFDSKKKENKKGLGMKNIESRVEILQGKYKIQTAVNEGFKITINL